MFMSHGGVAAWLQATMPGRGVFQLIEVNWSVTKCARTLTFARECAEIARLNATG
jgi:hypothetical protein